ncbi:type II toxin-antitoxin system CcdA family antitoxin [Xanthomonas maliensis]|uniref:type II toxin-antitoxin system CcdA family antitoxin n=1 Tax=Xanthomonas maliensis TaxID=1321368 RepID=UPI0003AAD00F|nr:type II toxin-antitoxin system CcdA family antitoxin [Xanthomonas maliensis]KAB7772480.1 plasmid maintenance protein CcdB [Xanthomonas maliensis]
MSRYYDVSAQTKQLNPTINSDLAAQARAMAGTLPAKVEELLAEYVTKERDSHSARTLELQRAASEWTTFTKAHGSFADGLSTL